MSDTNKEVKTPFGDNAEFLDVDGKSKESNTQEDDNNEDLLDDDEFDTGEAELFDDDNEEEEEDNKEDKDKKENKQEVTDSQATDEDILGVVDYINNSLDLGFDISGLKESKGNDIIKNFIESVQHYAVEEYKESNKQEYKTEIAKQIDELVSAGVDIDTALADYNSRTFEINNKLQQIESYDKYNLVGNYLMLKYGFSEDKARETLDMYEAKEILDIEYEKVLNAYKQEAEQTKKQIREQVFQDKLKKEQEKSESERLQVEQDRKEIYEMLSKTNTFLDIPLSATDKQQVLNFLFVPDKQGSTELEKVLQSNEHLLTLGILFKKYQDFFNHLKTSSKEEGKKSLFNKLSQDPMQASVKTSQNQDASKKKKLNQF
jgi:hypothetical protein